MLSVAEIGSWNLEKHHEISNGSPLEKFAGEVFIPYGQAHIYSCTSPTKPKLSKKLHTRSLLSFSDLCSFVVPGFSKSVDC